jgi:hypothetical protein
VAIRSGLPAIDDATEWVNSEPLTAAGLEGKVVAVQFGTYSCINWIRTIPYVRAWASAYRDRGLVVIGVQTPEFAFEREIEGVRRALAAMEVQYPIVLDNEYAIWNAFANRYWPALYIADGDARLQYEHFGEGAYGESEDAIRDLLHADGDRVDVAATGVEAAADGDALRSPETYVGFAQAERRAADNAQRLALNEWALSGQWSVHEQAAELEAAGGAIAYRFQARDVNLVLTPPPAGGDAVFTVRVDGEPPGEAHGIDVDPEGEGVVTAPRLYQLVREPGAVRERTLAVSFRDPGVRAYVFTFG